MTVKQCKIRILDEAICVIVGLDNDHAEQLYNRFAIKAPGYFFNPLYKLGRWDGKIRFFQLSGRTYVYLLDDILPLLKKFGYSCKLEDLRTCETVSPDPIDVDIFSQYTHPDTGLSIQLRPDQVAAVNALIEEGNGICEAGTGSGKAQSLNSKVLTSTGWKRMGDIIVGDHVVTPSGNTSTVIGVFPQGKLPLYRVTFHDGSSTLCCDEHLWTVNMPSNWWSAKTTTQTVPLSTLREFMCRKNSNVFTPGNISVQTTAPVNFPAQKPCDIPAYLMGALIGDGCLSQPNSIVFSSVDDHILTLVNEHSKAFDVCLKHKERCDYGLTKIQSQNTFPPSKNTLTQLLDSYKLMGCTSLTKFIPTCYKTASISERFDLIRGLFDTDGTVDKSGNVSYATSSYQLAKDVQEILWSLGATCSIKTKVPTYSYKGNRKVGNISYTLHVSIDDRTMLFSLPRKKERCISQFGAGRITHGRRVISIKLESEDEAQCIMIDDPAHLYITDDYIVTHNTFMCAALVTAYDKLGIKSITIVPDQSLIRQTKRDYLNLGLDTGEYSGKVKSLDHKHIVSTWQSLKNNPIIIRDFNMVIVDECHGLKGNILQKILIEHCINVPYRFGFTGTLPKEDADRMAVHVAVGRVKHIMKAHELIEMGVLAKLQIDILQLEENMHPQYEEFCKENEGIPGTIPTYIQYKDGYFPDFSTERSYLHRNLTRIDWIAELINLKRDAKYGNVLCLVDSIPFGRKLAERIPGAIFVNGQDVKDAGARQKIYDMFKDHNDLVVIATVHIAGTGLSIRRIYNLVFVDIGKSFIRTVQAIGRGLRTADDKDSVVVTDICSDLKYAKRHLKTRTNFYDEAQYPYKKKKVNYTET